MNEPKKTTLERAKFTARNAARIYEELLVALSESEHATPHASLMAIAMIAGHAIDHVAKLPGQDKYKATHRFLSALQNLGDVKIAVAQTFHPDQPNNN